MIAPKDRLVYSGGVVLIPLIALSTMAESLVSVPSALILVFIGAVVLDAALSLNRLKGISVSIPNVVRLTRDRAGEMEVNVDNRDNLLKKIRVGIPFPKTVISPMGNQTEISLPGDNPLSSFLWSLVGMRQGRHPLSRIHLEASSSLGLWAIRKSLPLDSEIRIYPNLFTEQRSLASLFLNNSLGVHTQRQIGKGREFAQLREYTPGDCYEDVHWKATAKQGKPITRVHQVERTQRVYVVIDASRLSAREAQTGRGPQPSRQKGAFPENIMERFVTAALLVGLAAEKQGDMFGLTVFGDRVQRFVRAKCGKAHYNVCRDALYTLRAGQATPDFSEVLTFLATKIRRRSLILFLTNLDDPVLAESFMETVNILKGKHLVMVNMMQPFLSGKLFSSKDVSKTDDLYNRLGGHILWSGLRETEKKLNRRGVGFTLLDNEKMCIQLISQYLGIKQRQLL